MRSRAAELRRVFGEPKTEGIATTTGQVLTMPSGVTREQAMRCVAKCSMENVLRDLATVAAREISNEMSASGLRPSDYAEDQELPKKIADRIVKELGAGPEVFERTIREQLKMKG